MGAIDMHLQQLHPHFQQNKIVFQPLNIKRIKQKRRRHKTLKQTFEQLFKLAKTKNQNAKRFYFCCKPLLIHLTPMLQNSTNLLNNETKSMLLNLSHNKTKPMPIDSLRKMM